MPARSAVVGNPVAVPRGVATPPARRRVRWHSALSALAVGTLDFPELRVLLGRDYVLANDPKDPTVGGWEVYRRMSSAGTFGDAAGKGN